MAVRPAPISTDLGALGRTLLPAALLVGVALLAARAATAARVDVGVALVAGVVVFLLAFVRTEIGLWLLVASMLLSPQIGAGGKLAEGRQLVLRTEDFLLIVIAASWLAKTAVHKELGLVLRTPLNRPIFAYVGVTAIATTLGYLLGNVRGAGGFFYVVKYVEYFFVYFMVVNNVSDRGRMRRLLMVAFATAAVASLIGIAQIPSGQRVSAPFEGAAGEPNTFGGYLLFMMAVLMGIALEARWIGLKLGALALVGLLSAPFVFTLSRASYLGLVPALLTLGALTRQRRLAVMSFIFLLVASPLVVTVTPDAVVKRVLYTFEPEADQPTVRLGKVAFDPSTSARLISFRQALEGWLHRPFLGYGVTGFGFMDGQYARTLAETGAIGLATFLWMVVALVRLGLDRARSLVEPLDRGLAIGFVAGTAGLLAHAIGANTFIIVRIMEPFWLFAGIVVLLPSLTAAGDASP
jgi:O-antigen ligase/polysaccharide polymerase Wzy-like membrane protein